ncbi:uncharacterized protein LOC126814488 isoform X2 [Patella vulgata]|uniref:uncharacterized protein LOC126814488 isoform X2 n=1 Tax=Patella vulgata TaxID=6465 RepID=UPI0021808FBD|nr:uncharacterized protein LOC126814488 isoform X2 [Patella vulgata]
MDEKFVDRTEVTLKTPKKQHLTKTQICSKLTVDVTNGHTSSNNTSPISPCLASSMLTDEDMEQAVFSTTSIDKENKVSTDTNLKLKAKDHAFTNISSSVEEDPSLNTVPVALSSPKKDEEVRSYYTPGFAIRAWAFEDIKHKSDEPESSKITHVESKERKTSVTSTLTVNKNKDFDLEKQEKQKTELSSLTFNIGKSPKKETSIVAVTMNKTVEYDLQDRSPQKKELSQATFAIGRKSSFEERSDTVTKSLLVSTESIESSSSFDSVFTKNLSKTEELNQRNLQKTDEVTYNSKNNTSKFVSQEHVTSTTSIASQDTKLNTVVTDEWVIISEEEKFLKAESNTTKGDISTIVSKSSVDSGTISSSPVQTKIVAIPVEVERKFSVGPDTEAKLKDSGAQLKSEKSFTDVYWDNEDYLLTLSDCWLRQRDSDWQMKIPVHSDPIFDVNTKYQELTKEKDIINFIANKLTLNLGKKSNLSYLLEKANLVDFATINTVRKSYILDGCQVDLDSTNHGFQVGEIEVVALSSSEIPSALRTIDKVAKKLGLSPLQLVL